MSTRDPDLLCVILEDELYLRSGDHRVSLPAELMNRRRVLQGERYVARLFDDHRPLLDKPWRLVFIISKPNIKPEINHGGWWNDFINGNHLFDSGWTLAEGPDHPLNEGSCAGTILIHPENQSPGNDVLEQHLRGIPRLTIVKDPPEATWAPGSILIAPGGDKTWNDIRKKAYSAGCSLIIWLAPGPRQGPRGAGTKAEQATLEDLGPAYRIAEVNRLNGVDDAEYARWIAFFVNHLVSGRPPDVALRNATLDTDQRPRDRIRLWDGPKGWRPELRGDRPPLWPRLEQELTSEAQIVVLLQQFEDKSRWRHWTSWADRHAAISRKLSLDPLKEPTQNPVEAQLQRLWADENASGPSQFASSLNAKLKDAHRRWCWAHHGPIHLDSDARAEEDPPVDIRLLKKYLRALRDGLTADGQSPDRAVLDPDIKLIVDIPVISKDRDKAERMIRAISDALHPEGRKKTWYDGLLAPFRSRRDEVRKLAVVT